MKRLFLAAVLALAALRAEAQVACVGSGCATSAASDASLVVTDVTTNDVSTSKHGFVPKAPADATKFLNGLTGGWAVPAFVTSSTLTSNTVPKATGAGAIGNSTITDDGTTVTLNTASTFLATPSGGSATSNFFKIVGTLATTNTAQANGANFQITGAGTSSQVQAATLASLLPGYTGSSTSYGLLATNQSVTTANTIATAAFALGGSSFGGTAASGTRIGVEGFAQSADTGVGLVGWGGGNTTANIGVLGQISNVTAAAQVGGWFTLGNAATTYTSTAIGADNRAVAAPIITARDNGTTVWQITDNGSQWAANAKTLTESSATAFARFTIASGSSGGLNIDYCVEANDSTDFQSRCGMLPVAVVNKAGTITCTVGTVTTATEVVALSSGTLANTFTCADSGTNFLDIKANAVSSLTQTTLRINYFPRQQGNAAGAFTPQ